MTDTEQQTCPTVETCPTCGSPVRINAGDEGTCCYVPLLGVDVDLQALLYDAIAGARLLLTHTDDPDEGASVKGSLLQYKCAYDKLFRAK